MPAQTVLVVDDEAPTRAVVRVLLEEAGFAVLEAPNGLVALELLHASAVPLVVLLDLMLPGMSGVEVLHTVAVDPVLADRDAYIIFSAARAFTAPTPLRFYVLGKRLFALSKPFHIEDLVAIVEQAALQVDSGSAGALSHADDAGDAGDAGKVAVEAPMQATDGDHQT